MAAIRDEGWAQDNKNEGNSGDHREIMSDVL